MTHTEILQLIETVSPDDTAALDEIDARVWCFLNFKTFIQELHNSNCGVVGALYEEPNEDGGNIFAPIDKYTRSRDALKAIRPEGCWVTIDTCIDGDADCTIGKYNADASKLLYKFGTSTLDVYIRGEELAELHCIVQAIAHEREQK